MLHWWPDSGGDYDEMLKDELAQYPSILIPFRAHRLRLTRLQDRKDWPNTWLQPSLAF